jgi:hypothetical protein
VETNHSLSGDILRILSNIPEHLRKSIILNKISEFSSLTDEQKSETINSVLDGYRNLDSTHLIPVLTTCFQIISTLDARIIVNTFCIYFETFLLHPELVQSIDLEPIMETLKRLSINQRHLLVDCYFEALLLHYDRDRLNSMTPEFALEFLRA